MSKSSIDRFKKKMADKETAADAFLNASQEAFEDREEKAEDSIVESSVDSKDKDSEVKNTGSKNASENASVSKSNNDSKITFEEKNDTANIANVDNIDIDVKKIIAKKKKKKRKFEDDYTKSTYWIRKDILKVFNSIANEHGEKTRMINEALLDYFKKLENEQ